MKLLFAIAFFITYSATAAPLIITPGDLNSYRIDVDLQFDGLSKRFQLDTGANTSMVAPDSQTSTYLSEGKVQLEGAAGQPFECDLISANTISIDALTVNKLQFKRCDLGIHSFHNLGLDLFRGQIIELDFKTNTLSLPTKIAEGWTLHPLIRLDRGHLKIDANINDMKLKVLFDTGAQLTAVDIQFVENNPELFTLIDSQEAGHDITGKPIFMKFYELTKIQIGAMVFEKTTVAAFDFGKLRNYLGENTPIILGANAIIQANWIFDLVSNQWAVQHE